MAIEVEKKFLLDDNSKQSLIKDAEFLGVKTFTDVYYDTSTFDLSRKDTWLRARDNRWELKIPLESFLVRSTDQYRELETELEIIEFLSLGKNTALHESLAVGKYKPLISVTTTRTKYKKQGFIIDLDTIDFGYELVEIEKMVANESEISKAEEEILQFAKIYNLQVSQVRGKVIEYLRRYNRKHFEALVEAGVALPDNT